MCFFDVLELQTEEYSAVGGSLATALASRRVLSGADQVPGDRQVCTSDRRPLRRCLVYSATVIHRMISLALGPPGMAGSESCEGDNQSQVSLVITWHFWCYCIKVYGGLPP